MSPIEISWLVMAAVLFFTLTISFAVIKDLKRNLRNREALLTCYRTSQDLYRNNLKHSWHQLEMIPCNDGKLRSRQYHEEAIRG